MVFEAKNVSGSVQQKSVPLAAIKLLTPKEAAELLKVSLSWLAKARMRGDGPPFIKIGRSIRYSEAGLFQWMKSHQHLSTSEH
jgi:predicted DNA-binding transcriptional regulator AlpA